MKKNTSACTNCPANLPPKLVFVKIYFSQKGQDETMASAFFNHYQKNKWKTKRGYPIKNWMTAANQWIWTNRPHKPMTLAIKLNIQFPDNMPLFYHAD